MTEEVEFGGGGRSVTSAYRNLCYADPRFASMYEGWEEIGQGGYALVVKVKSQAFGRTIALKIITNLSIEAGPRFQREVNVAASVSSKYVVRTFGSFVEGALAWMEMEYLEGTDLGRALARRKRDGEPFPLNEALDIAVASAQGLADAHEAGLIHRDIKPANIFLPKSRVPPAKILDLGIARHGEWEQFTRTDMILGTPEYASPEAALQKPLGPESDVHSLGQVFYELFGNLDRAYPHTTNAQAALGARVKWRTRPLHESNATVPGPIEALVSECLSLKLTGRPTAGEVCERLREIQRSLGLAPAGISPRLEALTPVPRQAPPSAPVPVAHVVTPEPVTAEPVAAREPAPPPAPPVSPPAAPAPVIPPVAEAPRPAAMRPTAITPAPVLPPPPTAVTRSAPAAAPPAKPRPAPPAAGRGAQVAAAAGIATLAIVAALFWRSSPAPSPELPLMTPPPASLPVSAATPTPTPEASPTPPPTPAPTPVPTPVPTPPPTPTPKPTPPPALGSVAGTSSPVTTTLRGRFVRLTVPSNLMGRRLRVVVTGASGKTYSKVVQADTVSLFLPVDDFSPAPPESESLATARTDLLP